MLGNQVLGSDLGSNVAAIRINENYGRQCPGKSGHTSKMNSSLQVCPNDLFEVLWAQQNVEETKLSIANF